MFPRDVQQGEPLQSYLARKGRKLILLRASKRTQAENDRSGRETHNLQQPFFKLPAELRNVIYEHLLPAGREIKRSLHHRSQGRVPALLQVCHQLRKETYALFFARNQVTVTLQHLTQHIRSPLRMRSCVNLLPENGTAVWRKVKIESCSRCFHSDGFAVLSNIDVFVDRNEGTVACQPRAAQYLRPCCQLAQREFSARLTKSITRHDFHDGTMKLRRDDFERLAQRMDENKADWPKSPRRVMPQHWYVS